MGMGVINKVVLVFPRIFWPITTERFGQLQDPITNGNQDDLEANRGKYFLFYNLYQETMLPCLVAYVSGQAAQTVERSTDDTIVNEILDKLSMIFPDETPLPKPIETVATRWGQDCYSRGCSTVLKPNGSYTEFSNVIQDAKRLYFAGEHISPNKPGSIAGT